MPEGIAAEAPPAPEYNSEWQLGPPDLILTAPQSFTVPADGQDLFRNFIYPVNVTRTRYVRAVEILPGNARVVHHANILIDRTAELRRQHPNDWRAGIPGMELEIGSGDRFDPDSHFLFWKPDTPAVVEPPGMPWRIDPGNDLILNTHLKPTGRVETVQPRIGLYFTDTPPTRAPMLLQLEHDAALNIPAGDSHFVVEDQLRLPIAVYALGIYPHAHYLGKQLEAWSIAPDGKRTPLILIKDWDIDRQSVYSYRKPLLLPAGSVLHMRYVYDNSAANPRNPANPPVRVRNGNRSTDEMGHLWLQVLPVHATERNATGKEIDSRMLLERAWMEHRLTRDPTDSLAAYNLASLDTMSGNPSGAIAIYRKLAAAQPNDMRTRRHFTGRSSRNSVTTGNPHSRSYKHALTLDPSYADARYDLATLELHHDQYEAAASDYRALIQQHPEDAAAHGGLAAALAQLSKTTPPAPNSSAPSHSIPRSPTHSSTMHRSNWPRTIPSMHRSYLRKRSPPARTTPPHISSSPLPTSRRTILKKPRTHCVLPSPPIRQTRPATRYSRNCSPPAAISRQQSLSSRPHFASMQRTPTAGVTSASCTHNPVKARRRAATSSTHYPSTRTTHRPAQIYNG